MITFQLSSWGFSGIRISSFTIWVSRGWPSVSVRISCVRISADFSGWRSSSVRISSISSVRVSRRRPPVSVRIPCVWVSVWVSWWGSSYFPNERISSFCPLCVVRLTAYVAPLDFSSVKISFIVSISRRWFAAKVTSWWRSTTARGWRSSISSSVIWMTFVSTMSGAFSNKIQKQIPSSHSTIVPSVVNFSRVFFIIEKNKPEPLRTAFLRVHDNADANSAPKHFVI